MKMSTAVETIKRMLDFAHRAMADAATGKHDQMHFVPDFGSHSMAWCLWHTVRVEDLIINRVIRHENPIWNEEWAKKTGLPLEGIGNPQTDEEAKKIVISDIEAFKQYQLVVWETTLAYLDTLSDGDLAEENPFGDHSETVSESISLHLLGHFNGHRGEMNYLRGMQGLPALLTKEGVH